jgi:NAD(P)-dependent dehydrogenase (short-subunit alcohol dehydrogenase family)
MANDAKRPTLHTKPYPAIGAEALKGTLDAQVVVITGAGGVLGRGESLAFAKAGAKLALIDLPRTAASLEAVVNECRAFGATTIGYHCNVIDPTESKKTLDDIQAHLGPVDVLVNNAGGQVDIQET